MLRKFILELYETFIFHAVASHFVNGLVPVIALFMLLTLLTGDIYFEHTVMHLLYISSLTVPITLISGIRDWRTKFSGARAPVFYTKIKLSMMLLLLCAAAVAIRSTWSDPLTTGGSVAWWYAGCLILMLPLVILLGHFGGKLATVARQKK